MSISKKIALPILLTVVGGFVAYFAFYAFLARTRSDTAFIELAGMQAVRAEQIGRLAYTRVEGFEWAREPLASTIARFDGDLRAMEAGGDVDGNALDPIPFELQAAMTNVGNTWESVERLASEIATRPAGDASLGDLYMEMRPLLPELNEAALSLIRAARSRTERLRRRMLVVLGVICVIDVLLMVAGFLLIARVVVRPLKRLESATLRVKDGDLDHQIPVSSRDEIGSVSGAFNEMSASLRILLEREKSTASSLRQLSSKLLTAQDEERRRIARELHDSTVQTIAAAAIRMDQFLTLTPADPDGGTPTTDAQQARDLLTDAMEEIRMLSYVLHPPMLERLGFVPALRDFVKGFSARSGVEAHLTIEEAAEKRRLPDDVALTLFRVAQESLANVARHADSDEATIRVSLDGHDARQFVVLEVEDEGRGIPPERRNAVSNGESAGGVGIAGMRERVEILGGTFELSSTETGTRVTVRLALDDDTDLAKETAPNI